MAEKNKVGEKVQQIRETRKISVEELSERSQLPLNQVRQIEAGDLIPSLAPLIKIARILGVRPGTFLDDHDNLGPVVSKKGALPNAVHFSDHVSPDESDMDLYALAENKSGRHMEPFIGDVNPSSKKEVHTSSHEGEEFIYVLSGKLEIIYGKDTFTLDPGDSIYYDSIIAHHVHSMGDSPAKILAVVYTPF
jgi:transcriptional regulator with XRE-family HTH domain